MKILIEIDITEDKTTADLTELSSEERIIEKIMTTFNLYKHDYVTVLLEKKKSEEEPAYRRQVDYVAEKQKRLLKINPSDNPFESIGYTKK